ncbi:hypothetical protein C8Q76DRAFT_688617 [Earliella scabrosa]|nr:hypothetical protein C8Q76DRAFT_688617 [Earliella scabrosa]
MSLACAHELQCPICYDGLRLSPYGSAIALQCGMPVCEPIEDSELILRLSGHMFCYTCLLAHQRNSRNCPSCRREIFRTIQVRLRDDGQGIIRSTASLQAELVSRLQRLVTLVEEHALGHPITLESLSTIVSLLGSCIDFASTFNLDGNTTVRLASMRELLPALQEANVRFQEDRVLVAQVTRWTALLEAERQALSALERQVNEYHRQYAELDGEKSLLLFDVKEVQTQIAEEDMEHQYLRYFKFEKKSYLMSSDTLNHYAAYLPVARPALALSYYSNGSKELRPVPPMMYLQLFGRCS